MASARMRVTRDTLPLPVEGALDALLDPREVGEGVHVVLRAFGLRRRLPGVLHIDLPPLNRRRQDLGMPLAAPPLLPHPAARPLARARPAEGLDTDALGRLGLVRVDTLSMKLKAKVA